MELKLDEKDLEILSMLSENAKLSSKQIAKKTSIPLTTVHNRIKKMEENKVIEKYGIKINFKKLGRGIPALIFITFSLSQKSGTNINLESLAKQILEIPNCEELMFLTSEYDAILRVNVADIEELSGLVTKKLRSMFGIDKTITAIILNHFQK